MIILIASLLRFIKLGDFPAGFNMDEAAKGYNAYSLLETGKSFRGLPYPLYFTDFTDQMPATAILYTYSVMPFVALFGLNETAVRLPAAIAGTITVFMLFLLTNQLFKDKKLALLSTFLLATNPWHILLSRFGIEPILFPLFFLSAWYCLEKGIESKKNIYLYFGVALLAINLYAYQTSLMIVPCFALLFLIFHRRFFLSQKYLLSKLTILFFVLSSPTIYLYLTQTQKMIAHYRELAVVYNLKHGIFYKFSLFLVNFISHFNPAYLIFIYTLPVIVFFIYGLKILIKKLNDKKIIFFLLTFIIVLIPPSLVSYINPSTTRGVSRTGFIEIIAAFGLLTLIKNKNFNKFRKAVIPLTIILIASNLFVLINLGFPYYLSDMCYQFGFKKLVKYINLQDKNYDRVVVTDKANQPFIFFLFYQKYPPKKFLNLNIARAKELSINPKALYQKTVSFDKYQFCNLDECYYPNDNNLYIARKNEIPNIKADYTIYNLDGSVFRIINSK